MKRTIASTLAACALAWSTAAAAGAPTPPPAVQAAKAAPKKSDVEMITVSNVKFREGKTLPSVKMSCLARGTLNDAKDNAIVSFHQYCGDLRSADYLIGPGKTLDTDKYFVVTCDAIGNTNIRKELSTGPTNSGLKMAFPRYTLQDIVEIQYRVLTEHYGIKQLALVLGGSYGAMMTYELAVAHPTFVRAILPMNGSVKPNNRMRWVLESSQLGMTYFPTWKKGNYTKNDPAMGTWSVMNTLGDMIPEVALPTREKYDEQRAFWDNLLMKVAPQDARAIYYTLEAWKSYDIADRPEFQGDVTKALSAIKARTVVVSSKHDITVTKEEVDLTVKNIPKARHVVLDSPLGHISCCGLDPSATAVVEANIKDLLAGR